MIGGGGGCGIIFSGGGGQSVCFDPAIFLSGSQ